MRSARSSASAWIIRPSRGSTSKPAFHAGRHGRHDPMQRMTNPDIIKLIEAQTEGMFRDDRLHSRAVLLSDVQFGDVCLH